MSFVSHLRSIYSGEEHPAFDAAFARAAEGRPVEMVLDLDRLRHELPELSWYRPERRDMWRFGALMPLDSTNAAEAASIVTLGEGNTPLLEFDDHPLARQVGFRLWVKDEGEPHPAWGANPTGSFKDRGMAVVVSMARRLGLNRLVAPTQGNAGDALLTYARAAGIEAAVVAPRDTPAPILQRLEAASSWSGLAEAGASSTPARVELVTGTIREAAAVVRERYVPEGYVNVATFQEPGWRVEGKKTMGYELAEPNRISDRWELPDVVVYPTGGGTGILGIWKAFAELEGLGLIDERRPRMIAVQTEATSPVVRAYDRGDEEVEPVDAGTTIAAGLNVPSGIGHRRVLEIIRESGGAALAVSEEHIRSTLEEVNSVKGWMICPEGAACLAALEELIDRRLILEGDRVVTLNTASAAKYNPVFTIPS